jgi:hypothetical protein
MPSTTIRALPAPLISSPQGVDHQTTEGTKIQTSAAIHDGVDLNVNDQDEEYDDFQNSFELELKESRDTFDEVQNLNIELKRGESIDKVDDQVVISNELLQEKELIVDGEFLGQDDDGEDDDGEDDDGEDDEDDEGEDDEGDDGEDDEGDDGDGEDDEGEDDEGDDGDGEDEESQEEDLRDGVMRVLLLNRGWDDLSLSSVSSGSYRGPPTRPTSYRIQYSGPSKHDRFAPERRKKVAEGPAAPLSPRGLMDAAPAFPARNNSSHLSATGTEESNRTRYSRPNVWITPMGDPLSEDVTLSWKVKRVWEMEDTDSSSETEHSVNEDQLFDKIKVLVGANLNASTNTFQTEATGRESCSTDRAVGTSLSSKDGMPKMPKRNWRVQRFIEEDGELKRADEEEKSMHDDEMEKGVEEINVTETKVLVKEAARVRIKSKMKAKRLTVAKMVPRRTRPPPGRSSPPPGHEITVAAEELKDEELTKQEVPERAMAIPSEIQILDEPVTPGEVTRPDAGETNDEEKEEYQEIPAVTDNGQVAVALATPPTATEGPKRLISAAEMLKLRGAETTSDEDSDRKEDKLQVSHTSTKPPEKKKKKKKIEANMVSPGDLKKIRRRKVEQAREVDSDSDSESDDTETVRRRTPTPPLPDKNNGNEKQESKSWWGDDNPSPVSPPEKKVKKVKVVRKVTRSSLA